MKIAWKNSDTQYDAAREKSIWTKQNSNEKKQKNGNGNANRILFDLWFFSVLFSGCSFDGSPNHHNHSLENITIENWPDFFFSSIYTSPAPDCCPHVGIWNFHISVIFALGDANTSHHWIEFVNRLIWIQFNIDMYTSQPRSTMNKTYMNSGML